MATLFLTFCRTSILFSIVVTPIYIATNRVVGFSFLHILPGCFLFVFDSSYPDGCKVILHCSFDLCFSLIISSVEHLFHVPIGLLHVFLSLLLLMEIGPQVLEGMGYRPREDR